MPGQVNLSNVTMPEPMFSNNADRGAHGKRGDIHSSNCGWRGERDGFPAERRTKRPLAGTTDCHVYGRSGACSPGTIAAAGTWSGREVNEIRQRLLMAHSFHTGTGRYDPFGKSSANDRYLRAP